MTLAHRYGLLRNSSIFDDMMDVMGLSVVGPGSEHYEDPVKITHEKDDKNYYVRAVVPGFTEEELSISIENSILTVSGTHDVNVEKAGLHSSSHSSFSQTVHMAPDAAIDNINAERKDGILVITIPRSAPELKSKTIPIKCLPSAK